MFRSEYMSQQQLLLQPESAYAVIAALGEAGCVKFRDISSDGFNRNFNYEVTFCHDILLRLEFLWRRLVINHIPVMRCPEPRAPSWKIIKEIGSVTEHLTTDLKGMIQNVKTIKKNLMEFTLMKEVFVKISGMGSDQKPLVLNTLGTISKKNTDTHVESGLPEINGNIRLIAGVVPMEKLANFEKMLWRVCRGNLLYRCEPITNQIFCPETGQRIYQVVFELFVHGSELETRVLKICQGFHATVYPCPMNNDDMDMLIEICEAQIADSRLVLRMAMEQKREILRNVAKTLEVWMMQIEKAKAVYTVLSMFNVDMLSNCLVGEFWAPVCDLPRVKEALRKGFVKSEAMVEPIMKEVKMDDEPPTYIKTNKFTSGFQALINAYGVPGYREINPTPFTIIMFPFLFAIMFGDVGHGIILGAFGLWMVMNENIFKRVTIGKEIWTILFEGRYIILLMGVFSIYAGFIYNDIFSLSMNIFGSRWKYNLTRVNDFQLDPKFHVDSQDSAYTFGVDPVWHLSQNKIIFHNAFKMKMSIIFGVAHMLLGLFVSLANYWHFENIPAIFCEFIPQLLFLSCLFVYLVFLMFFKWIKYNASVSSIAPSILLTFVDMLMFKKSQTPFDPFMFPHQEDIQKLLVYIALICVPWMLLAKPTYIYFMRKGDETRKSIDIDVSNEEEDSLSEVIVHQSIHTIEYVLGTVSHTASYLRLWALSLAHSQLAEVLWMMVFHKLGLQITGSMAPLLLWIIFAVWALGTVAILVVMEGLSAFLHTLRLHWVEFQSKFYVGQGYDFVPFSFKEIIRKIEGKE